MGTSLSLLDRAGRGDLGESLTPKCFGTGLEECLSLVSDLCGTGGALLDFTSEEFRSAVVYICRNHG